MEHAWLKVVATSVAHRPGLAELERVDPVRTRQWLSKLKADDRAAYRKLLNGSHITQDGKHYCQESDTDVCLYCECSDSRFHRFWGCEAFSDCRDGVSPQLWDAIPYLPECVTCYGWAMQPTTALEWFQHLQSLPPCAVPTHPWPTVEHVHAFTDGSCCFPTLPDVRHAAFAIVLADPCMEAPAVILESGPLPGIRQTSIRAELFAVHRAIKFAACRGVSLMLWSDCQSVVRRLRRILLGAEVKINSPNSDLWTLISNDLHGGGCSVQVTKIAAHRSIASACSPLEEWGFVHNGFADRAAASANQARGAEFWDILARHSQACLTVDHWNAMIQKVLLQISRRVLHAGREKTIQAEPLTPPAPSWGGLPQEPVYPAGAIRWYGVSMVRKIVQWFWTATSDDPGPVVWVSNAQLFVDYVLTTGDTGPIKVHGWCDSANVPLHGLRHIGFKERARWFGKVFREICRHANLDVMSKYCRPTSQMICMHASCVALPFAPCRLEKVDRWFNKFTDAPFRRQARELDHLPVPG